MMKNLLFYIFIFVFSLGINAQDENKKTQTSNTRQGTVSISKITAYPNPFVQSSKITFYSNIPQNIYFEVKNILGKSVFKYHISAKNGINEIIFHRDNLLDGMYLYTLQTDTEVISKRLVIK